MALAMLALPLAAQQGASTIPAFPLGTSPIALTGDARAGQFVSSAGRRGIAMGTEDGRFEVWSWPIKWMHDFQLAFRVPKYAQSIAGRDVARHVTVRPEGVTIEYAYETFTVKQTVFSVLDQPAVVMLLEVDAVRPMEIIASFTPDVHFAWPASLGGQYLTWNAGARAFLFSESRRKVNAFLGSPAITQASDVPAHQLTAAPPQFTIGVGDAAQRYTEPRLGEPPGGNVNVHVAYIPIVLAGGEMPRDSARALYDRLLQPGALEREWKRRVAHADSILDRQLVITTGDRALDLAAQWAKVNLDDAMVCNPDLGCGLVAGYGLSGGASDRPGFGWFFGGDASINSFAMSAAGQGALVREGTLDFFARYQRADGKITHEVSQGAGKVDWFGAYPYAYYHGDTTPFWILAFGEYWKQTADTATVRRLWGNLKRAYEWSRQCDTDGDGLMENTCAGAGALEVGDLQQGIVSDVYLSGVWVAALARFARMAEAMNEPALAAEARAIRGKALATLEAKFWIPSRGQYAFALLEGGKVNETMTAWPATAMAFDVLDHVRGRQMAERLAASDLMTDWGARPLSATSPLFDPLHYNNGAVWPFVTGWVSAAQFRYGNPAAGLFALRAIANTTFDESRGRNPEVISGRVYKPLDTAVPQQFFATSMVLTPMIRGLLGIDVDAPTMTLNVAPALPIEMHDVAVRNVAVGPVLVDLTLRRSGGKWHLDVIRRSADTSALNVRFAPWPGADRAAIVTEGTLSSRLALSTADAGWDISTPPRPPRIGDRSQALRIVATRAVGSAMLVTMEGRAGAAYRITVREPGGRVRDELVQMPSAGADTDGYVRLEKRFTP